MINEISVRQQFSYKVIDLKTQNKEIQAEQSIRSPDSTDYLINSNKNNKKINFDEKTQKISNDILDELKKEFDIINHLELKFSRDKETGETYVKILDKDSGKVIKEIPPEEIRKLAEKLQKMIGLLFDKKA